MKTLLIGIDGADYYYIKNLLQKGSLPRIKKIIDAGIFLPLKTTIPENSAVAWPSIYTGTNPGKHGCYDFFYRPQNDISLNLINYYSIKAEPIWSILDRYGKKSILINVPITYPPFPLNGLLVCGINVPEGEKNICYPKEISEELWNKFPEYSIKPPFIREKDINFELYLDKLIHLIEMRTEVTRWLMAKLDWNFTMVVFTSSDSIQHYAGYHPLLNKIQDPFYKTGAKKAILKIYQKIDEAVGHLIDISEPDYIFLISDHGSSPSRGYILNLALFLYKEGFLKFKLNKKAVNIMDPDIWNLPIREFISSTSLYQPSGCLREDRATGEIEIEDISKCYNIFCSCYTYNKIRKIFYCR